MIIRLIDAILFSIERLWNHRILVFLALIGLVAGTTLALSLPLYVDAVNSNLLTARLPNPPYAFRFRYLGSWRGNINPNDALTAKAAVRDGFTNLIGLPPTLSVDFMRGSPYSIRLVNGNNTSNLGAFSLGTLSGTEKQMQIVKGTWPPAASDNAKADDPYPVLLSDKMLYKMGVDIGDILQTTPTGASKAIRLKVAAMWEPINASDPTWVFPPKFFDEIILMRSDDLVKIMTGLKTPIEEAAWFVNFDGRTVKTADVDGLLTRISDGERLVSTTLPGVRLELSPANQLQAFSSDVSRLTQQLIIMLMPVGGLVFYFVSLVAGLLVSRQQGEDVTLRSRGMSRFAILRIHVLMWLILAAAALAIGIALAPPLVQIVGKTTSFLRFDNTDAPLTIAFTPLALATGTITGLIAASSGLLMAWRTTRQTITSFKQQSARASRAWWQRSYLDILILIPAYYVLFTLKQRGGLATGASDPFSDPLVFLGPTLFALGNTLLFLRVWPFVMRISARLISYSKGVAVLMALRELTRSIGRYRGALLMMVFTLSLIGFTASMASTLDRSLEDTINYQVGADAVLITPADAQSSESVASSGTETTQTVTGFTNLPVDDLRRIDGVLDVARVGRYPGQARIGGQLVPGTVLGVDRASLAAVTTLVRTRTDYAATPLADLMNKLAGDRSGILISAATANQYKLKINQVVTFQVQALGAWYETKAPIVGVFTYFPTLVPANNQFFIISNLEPIWELIGTELPVDVWLALKPGADVDRVKTAVSDLGFPILEWRDPVEELHVAKTSPARRGVLGFLSVGFIASIVLTLVGSIIQNAASFRAQVIQLGSLRAMGLGSASVAVYLIVSQGLAVTSGILSGTGIGAATTLLFLPLLDFSGGLPPYMVRVAWVDILTVYAIFSGVLFVVTLVTTIILGRQSLFTVVKLGDNG